MSSNDLMLAILAMDFYNRGYDAGRFEDRVRRRSMPRFSATEPWRIGRDAHAMDNTPPGANIRS